MCAVRLASGAQAEAVAVYNKEATDIYRMRKRLAAGRGSENDRATVAAYEAVKPSRRPKGAAAPYHSAPHAAPTQREPSREVPFAAPSFDPSPPADTSSSDDGWRTVDFGAPPTADKPGHDPGGACTIPNCPECRKAKGALRCGTTGELVHPPMELDAAEMMGDLLLGAIGLACRAVREDHASVPASPEDRRKMAKALVMVQHRRAGWIGAFDDLLLLFGVMGLYTKRALTAEGTPPKKRLAASAPVREVPRADPREQEEEADAAE